jgi:hypothetical protein
MNGSTLLSQPLTPPEAATVPLHWTHEQRLAVFECLQGMRAALWTVYGPQVQQDWRDQLVPNSAPPELDPDKPF